MTTERPQVRGSDAATQGDPAAFAREVEAWADGHDIGYREGFREALALLGQGRRMGGAQ